MKLCTSKQLTSQDEVSKQIWNIQFRTKRKHNVWQLQQNHEKLQEYGRKKLLALKYPAGERGAERAQSNNLRVFLGKSTK